MDPATECLRELSAGATLSADQAERAIGSLLDGEAPRPSPRRFLTAIRIRGETADELGRGRTGGPQRE